MTIARRDIAPEGVEGDYHCTVRCVRQARLCGQDEASGRNYDHRKAWIRERLAFLVSLFALEVLGYAILSNHWHALLRTLPGLARRWAAEEVARRWLLLYPSRRMRQAGEAEPSMVDIERVLRRPGRVEVLRKRLSSQSWFMRCVDEHIARRANREDGCKGRFWEGRFKSRALLDEAAVLTALTYVDLNPIRAGLADTPEESEYTSAWERIVGRQAEALADRLNGPAKLEEQKPGERSDKIRQITPTDRESACSHTGEPSDMDGADALADHATGCLESTDAPESQEMAGLPDRVSKTRSQEKAINVNWLCPLKGSDERRGVFQHLTLDEYLQVLDGVGRVIRVDKPGSIPAELAPIMERLELDLERWVSAVQDYDRLFRRIVGRPANIRTAAERAGRRWFQGITSCLDLYLPLPPSGVAKGLTG